MRFVPAILLVACSGGASVGGGGSPAIAPGTAVVDEDGDGSATDLDCDDLDAASAPGNPEIACDGRDNDCALDGDDRAGCDRTFETADIVIPIPDAAGLSMFVNLAIVKDVTGDGRDDFTAMGMATSDPTRWAMHGWSPGSADPTVSAFELEDILVGHATFPGDLTADGIGDVLANPRSDWRTTDLYAGPLQGADADGGSATLGPWDLYGASIAWDSDGDGAAEVLAYWQGMLTWAAPPFDVVSPGPSSRVVIEDDEDGGEEVYLPQLGRADLDGDGTLELLASNSSVLGAFAQRDDGKLHVLTGTPGPAADWTTEIASFWQNNNHSWAWADFDADGHLDVAAMSDTVLEVAYGPFTYAGEVSMTELAGLTIDGAKGTMALVPDSDGDGAPEVLYRCDEWLVHASLRVRGHVADGCAAGLTYTGTMSLYDDDWWYSIWFGGGDFDGDGSGDVLITDWLGLDDGAGATTFRPSNFLIWSGSPG